VAAEWVRLCRARDLTVDEPHIEVAFKNERRHRVSVEDTHDSYQLTAVVVRQRVVAQQADLPLQAWLRNRATQLVGFRIDRRGRLVAEAWVPKAGLTAQEFQLYVRTVAAESDAFEYALTGADME